MTTGVGCETFYDVGCVEHVYFGEAGFLVGEKFSENVKLCLKFVTFNYNHKVDNYAGCKVSQTLRLQKNPSRFH